MKTRVALALLLVAATASAERPAPPDPAKVAAQKEYTRHLRAGRARARQKDWAGAAAEFDAALAALPGDGWALTERGYVALQAGDLAVAEARTEAATHDPRPRVQGAAFYNLGQIAEKKGATDAAIKHYLASHEAWPSVAATGRVAALGGKVPYPGSVDDGPSPCARPVAEGKLCVCLVAEAKKDEEEGVHVGCRAAEVEHGAAGLKVLAVTAESEVTLHLAARGAGGWSVVGELATVYLGGSGGVNTEFGVGSVERRRAGETELAWVEIAESRSDNDLGIDEVTYESTRTVSVCRLGEGARCLLHVPVEHSTSRERLGGMEDAEIDAETRAMMTKGLPLSGEIKLKLVVDPAGTATVTKASEKASPGVDLTRIRRYVGQVKLW